MEPILRQLATAELVQLIEEFFAFDVYREFIWSCAERGEEYFDTALREWAIEKILDNMNADMEEYINNNYKE